MCGQDAPALWAVCIVAQNQCSPMYGDRHPSNDWSWWISRVSQTDCSKTACTCKAFVLQHMPSWTENIPSTKIEQQQVFKFGWLTCADLSCCVGLTHGCCSLISQSSTASGMAAPPLSYTACQFTRRSRRSVISQSTPNRKYCQESGWAIWCMSCPRWRFQLLDCAICHLAFWKRCARMHGVTDHNQNFEGSLVVNKICGMVPNTIWEFLRAVTADCRLRTIRIVPPLGLDGCSSP